MKTLTDEQIVKIAMMVHEADRSWAAINGDTSKKPWNEAPDWARQSSITFVRYRIDHPSASISDEHDRWMAGKLNEDPPWKYGPTRDDAAKTNPLLVPFEQLPEAIRAKNALMCAVADSLINA